MSATGIVVALQLEARCLRAAKRTVPGSSSWHGHRHEPRALLTRLEEGSLLCVGGVGPEAAEHAARVLVRAGAQALLSWGVAGALDASLRCGSIILPGEVLRAAVENAAPERFNVDAGWHEHLARTLGGVNDVVQAALLSVARPIADQQHKSALFLATHAVAVDMESAAVAAVAREHALPFAALRVIIDTARDHVPRSVLRAYAAEADPAWSARTLTMLSSPGDWPGLLRLARRWRVARRTLHHCARRLELVPAQASARA